MPERVNPFATELSLANSNYACYAGGRLIDARTGKATAPLTEFVHDEVRALILNDRFPCFGAKSAFRLGTYRFGLYGDMGTAAATAGLARDLFTFADERAAIDGTFTTFLASFTGPTPPDEHAFERQLWATLQALHDLDAPHHAWDPSVSDDPDDPLFSFSFAGTAFFVVGLHAASSRAARRFAWPTLVFNAHDQFEALRESGRFPRFQRVIRQAEETLQGTINPMLADYGARSEATQYSGRQVEPTWRCPFHAHRDAESD
jgi:FPC/CPF motif-containing protein YcgG